MVNKILVSSWVVLVLSVFSLNLQAEVPSVKPVDSLSYADLAESAIASALFDLEIDLSNFNKKSLPHEAKGLRKQIGKVKALLDLFAYAYHPVVNEDGDTKDVFRKMRKDLDKGYEYFGNFKDKYDMQGVSAEEAVYKKKEIKPLRKICLEWVENFTKLSRMNEYKNMIDNASDTPYYRKKLSRFSWGAFIKPIAEEGPIGQIVNFVDKDGNQESYNVTLVPSAEKTGVENVAMLMKATLELATHNYDHILDLGSLEDHENAEHFHDYRKRLRMVAKNHITYFPEIVGQRSAEIDVAYDLLVDVSDNFGDVNDLVTKMFNLEAEGKMDEAHAMRPGIDEKFAALKVWLKENSINDKVVVVMEALK